MKKIVKVVINLMVLVTMILCGALLIHDFVFWGIIPMFSGITYQLTYFGLLIDVICMALLDLSIQIVKEW